jgi:hypothetical protein
MAIRELTGAAIRGLTKEFHYWLMQLRQGVNTVTSDPSFLVLSADATLTNERVLTVGHGMDGADAGAGSTFTLDVDESELSHALLGV